MTRKALYLIYLTIYLLFCKTIQGQDTLEKSTRQNFFNNIYKRALNSVTASKKDSTIKATVLNTKSESPYLKYEGKIIRKIIITELGFEKVFTDTSQVIKYYGTRILNKLHTDTWDWVIRDNLFIRPGMRLNRFMVADNERYLRSLNFIQDARIIARPIRGISDSVDLEVITKDLFSITGSLEVSSPKRQRMRITENNLAGAGQRLQVSTLLDQRRNPSFGYNVLYTKNSLLHTFVNTTIGLSQINKDRQGDEDVKSIYFQLERPLVSPYSHAAGGFQLSFDRSLNVFERPDSFFYNYRSSYVDLWAGYNLGVKKIMEDNKNRNRVFVAARYFQNKFSQVPFQVGERYDSYFNNRKALLATLTLFRQDFYQTNYIYGFGTTEDVPYGYNIEMTGGWYKQLNLSRPYFGFNANRYYASARGEFLQTFLRGSIFLNEGKAEDASVIAGGSFYSRLYQNNSIKMREYVKVSYTRLFNRVALDPLRINNSLGIQNFSNDSLTGTQRLSVYAETFLFLKYKLLGFKLAPFVFIDGSLLTGEHSSFFKSDQFTGIGGGIRTRNENLTFGTAEVRFVFFPRKAEGINTFKLTFKGNIRFRSNTNYVRAPDFINLNSEDSNSFY